MMRILCPAMKSRPRWLQLKKKLNKEAIPKKKKIIISWAKSLHRCFAKEYIQAATKYVRSSQHQ